MGRRITSPTIGVGLWLRTNRESRGWTLEVMAEKAGTAAPVISNIERGKRGASRKMIRRLAEALSARPEQFPLLYDEGLIAAGFGPEYGAYSVTPPETGVNVQLVPLTPEERAIIEQIRAMAQTPAKTEQESRRERIARDEADDDSRQAIEERYRSTREADIFDR